MAVDPNHGQDNDQGGSISDRMDDNQFVENDPMSFDNNFDDRDKKDGDYDLETSSAHFLEISDLPPSLTSTYYSSSSSSLTSSSSLIPCPSSLPPEIEGFFRGLYDSTDTPKIKEQRFIGKFCYLI